MERINIVIDDDNAYFVVGLRFSITEYAEKNHKTVSFLSPDDGVQADMVIAASMWRAQRWRKMNPCEPVSAIMTIKEKRVGHVNECESVLYRTDNRSRLFELLTKSLVKIPAEKQLLGYVLTSREKQVIGYLKKGFDQSQTAKLLGVNVKTVHSHKRSVMKKLMLNRQREFMYWLISQDD
ncbi:TPA: helix-turn-helix transcriptional regulator [Serratia marcescens]